MELQPAIAMQLAPDKPKLDWLVSKAKMISPPPRQFAGWPGLSGDCVYVVRLLVFVFRWHSYRAVAVAVAAAERCNTIFCGRYPEHRAYGGWVDEWYAPAVPFYVAPTLPPHLWRRSRSVGDGKERSSPPSFEV